MKISLVENESLFADLRDEWGDLLNDSAANRIFMTREWQSIWWDAYQPGDIWTLTVRADDGDLLGLAPWFIDRQGGERVVRAIGCADVTDYLEVIARHGFEEAVIEALVEHLGTHQDAFDRVELCNVPQDSPMLDLMPRLAEAAGMTVRTEVEDVCPLIRLPAQWQDYVAGLDKKNRHELRRKIRRAAGAAEVAWYVVNGEHYIIVELDKCLALMAASSEEKAIFLQDEPNQKFFKSMVPAMAERGWLQLAFLTVNGEPAASYLNFDYGNRVLVYNSGHNAGEHGHLSPGIVLLARLIEYAIEEGRDVFDFLRGDEPYKYDMGGKDTCVYTIQMMPASGA